jgi:translation elongation factor EF-Tu-like GTPase
VFPELMAEMRLVSALSNELWLLDDDEDKDDAVRLEIRELLCKLEIDMKEHPFPEISQALSIWQDISPELCLYLQAVVQTTMREN